VWSCLAIGSLLAAVRACWDRFPSDAVVWFRPVNAHGVLEQGPRRWTVRLTAISERGVELSWSASDPGGELPQPHRPLLIHADCLGTDPLSLRLEQMRSSGDRVQLGALWLWRSEAEAFRLQGELYQQPGAWPVLQAPPDRLAVLALLKRRVWPSGPEGWFARSALPICFPRTAATLTLPVLE